MESLFKVSLGFNITLRDEKTRSTKVVTYYFSNSLVITTEQLHYLRSSIQQILMALWEINFCTIKGLIQTEVLSPQYMFCSVKHKICKLRRVTQLCITNCVLYHTLKIHILHIPCYSALPDCCLDWENIRHPTVFSGNQWHP